MPSTFAQPLNDFATTLASAHVAADGHLVLAASPGTLAANRVWRVTALSMPDTSSESVLGIFQATGNTGATLNGVTGAEGYSDAGLASGTAVQIRMTALDLAEVQAAVNAAETTIATVAANQVTDEATLASHTTELASHAASIGTLTGEVATIDTTLGTLGSAAFTASSAYDAAGLAAAAQAAAESYAATQAASANAISLQGHNVATTAPTDTYVLTWVASTSKWTPEPAAGGGGITIGTTPVSGGTAGRVLFEGVGPVVADDNLLQYNSGTGQLTVWSVFILTDVISNGGQFQGNSLRDVGGTRGVLNAVPGYGWVASPATSSGSAFGCQGLSGQSAPLSVLQQISSTSTARDVAYVDGQFNSAVDASYTGIAVLDAVSAGPVREHGCWIVGTGSGANAVWFEGSVPNFQGMVGGHYLSNATTAPSGNPSGGGYLYASGGALYWMGSSGTSTKIANA